jgi:hypothetical protein
MADNTFIAWTDHTLNIAESLIRNTFLPQIKNQIHTDKNSVSNLNFKSEFICVHLIFYLWQ